MPGLTATGFESKTLETIRAEIVADLLANISTTLDTDTESPLGQLVGIFARQLRQVWELAEATYSGQYPDSASGFSLTALALLTGTSRLPATKSTVECTVNVDPGTYLPGTLVAHVSGDATLRFVNVDTVTNGGGSPANVTDITFEAEETGVVRANASTLTVIAEPVSGWNSITNPADATLGTEIESDTALRLRREEELASSGSTTVDAIKDAILDVADVIAATVLENDTNATVDGIPAKSIEAIVRGGVDADIAAAILAEKPAGIQAFGSEGPFTVTDAQGNDHSIDFTRPTVVNVYLEVDLDVVSADYAGDTAVEEALVDFGDLNYEMGDDVILSKLEAIIHGLTGIYDVTEIRVGNAPSPVSTSNYTIDTRELADLDTARITITATPV